MSSVTILLHVTYAQRGQRVERDLVVRMPPDTASFPVFRAYDLRLQYDAMKAAGEHGVPVPPLVGVEEDTTLLGAPFIVMEAVGGEAPVDNPPYVFGGWLFDAAPDLQRQLQDETLRMFSLVHAIPEPGERIPGVAIADGADALRAHFEDQLAYYEWVCQDGPRVPLLERTFDWLEEHWPSDTSGTVLSWGDARPGNILYEDFRANAVLDWEMAGLGPREIDLGWVVFIHRFFQDIAEVFELPGMKHFLTREDVTATYEDLTGHRARDLDWYIVYAALRHGIVMARIKTRMIHFGEEQVPEDVDDYVMHRAALEALMAGTYAWPEA
jgi:aminoglycoside phosphotransferase (APT) family kinase protein